MDTLKRLNRITVPDMGDFKQVPVIEILVAKGDLVEKDQPLVTLESDKAVMEIPSTTSGVVSEIHVRVGDRVSAGSLLLTMNEQPAATQPQPVAARQAVDAPVLSKAAEPVAVEPPDSNSLQAAHPLLTRGEQVSDSGAPVSAAAGRAAPAFNVIPFAQPSERADEAYPRVYAGPAVRKFAREFGVNLRLVKGTGPRGRIVQRDVHEHIRSAMSGSEREQSPGNLPLALPPWPKVDHAKFGPIEIQPLSRIRKISGANLHRNWISIPHVTNHDDADVTELEGFRTESNRAEEKGRIAISPLAFIMKACAAALRIFPDFNSSVEGETLIVKQYYHIGFAVDTPNGLVVPVIRNTDQKGILQIATEMAELAAKARAGKLASSDMQGGTFSVSSLGAIGGSYFTPIINAPEVAILGVGKIQTRVVWKDGQAQPRLYMPLSLSWDHRVIDGAAAGRFNAFLVRMLADVRRLLL